MNKEFLRYTKDIVYNEKNITNPSKKGLGGITYPPKPESGSKPKPSGIGFTPVQPKPIEEVKNVVKYAEQNYQKEANIVFRELNKYLILIAISIFSFSLFIFQKEELITKLKYLDKIFLIILWVVLAASIIFGVIQFIIEYFFFKKWKETHSKILAKLSKNNDKGKIDDFKIYSSTIQQQENIPTESNYYCGYMQFFTLGIAFIILIYFMVQVIS